MPNFKPAPHGSGAFLNGVSCASASACTAVGNQTLTRTLAERWNGTRWRVQATANPPGGQNIFLAGVACPTHSVCTAFGLNLTGSGPLTLAERWSGGRWRIQPTPGLVAFDIGFPGVARPDRLALLCAGQLHQRRPERDPRRAVEPDRDEHPGPCRPAGGTRRPASRLHRRPHGALAFIQRPDPD